MTTTRAQNVPTVWAICDECEGEGTRALGGLAITGSEWAEWDQDDRDTYLSGGYDRPCASCGGSGKVKVADVERMTADQLAELEAERWDRAEREAERRMGC